MLKGKQQHKAGSTYFFTPSTRCRPGL